MLGSKSECIVKMNPPLWPDLYPTPRPAMLPNHEAPAGDIMNRSAPSMTSPAAAVAAAYHGVRAAMPLDLLPGRKPHGICYCCRQPTNTPRPFLPLLPAAGSTRLLLRATLPYQITHDGRVHTAGGHATSRGIIQRTLYLLPSQPIVWSRGRTANI